MNGRIVDFKEFLNLKENPEETSTQTFIVDIAKAVKNADMNADQNAEKKAVKKVIIETEKYIFKPLMQGLEDPRLQKLRTLNEAICGKIVELVNQQHGDLFAAPEHSLVVKDGSLHGLLSKKIDYTPLNKLPTGKKEFVLALRANALSSISTLNYFLSNPDGATNIGYNQYDDELEAAIKRDAPFEEKLASIDYGLANFFYLKEQGALLGSENARLDPLPPRAITPKLEGKSEDDSQPELKKPTPEIKSEGDSEQSRSTTPTSTTSSDDEDELETSSDSSISESKNENDYFHLSFDNILKGYLRPMKQSIDFLSHHIFTEFVKHMMQLSKNEKTNVLVRSFVSGVNVTFLGISDFITHPQFKKIMMQALVIDKLKVDEKAIVSDILNGLIVHGIELKSQLAHIEKMTDEEVEKIVRGKSGCVTPSSMVGIVLEQSVMLRQGSGDAMSPLPSPVMNGLNAITSASNSSPTRYSPVYNKFKPIRQQDSPDGELAALTSVLHDMMSGNK